MFALHELHVHKQSHKWPTQCEDNIRLHVTIHTSYTYERFFSVDSKSAIFRRYFVARMRISFFISCHTSLRQSTVPNHAAVGTPALNHSWCAEAMPLLMAISPQWPIHSWMEFLVSIPWSLVCKAITIWFCLSNPVGQWIPETNKEELGYYLETWPVHVIKPTCGWANHWNSDRR